MDTIEENNDNHALSPPNRVLGYTIRSRTKIYISYVVPTILATCVYIVQFVADISVSYEHFKNHQSVFGAATLCLVLIPPILTLILVLSSKKQRENPKHPSRKHFFWFHILQTLLFPFFVIYRFAVRIFWSIEALFQENNDAERMLCLERASETATCELYLFIQAFAQAAPQIILQMYHMLIQDMFRDYQTTTVQGICLVFSAIDLASVTTSYQRFESQHQVGRAYPWSSPKEVEAQQRLLQCDSRLRNECACRKRDSERSLTHFPESETIMKNFERQHSVSKETIEEQKTHSAQVHSFDEVDNDAANDTETTTLIPKSMSSQSERNATDDDKIRSNPKLNITPRADNSHELIDEITVLDTVPDSPPPPLPPRLHLQESFNEINGSTRNTITDSRPPILPPRLNIQQSYTQTDGSTRNTTQNKRSSKTLLQLETFKDMLIVNAQLYIKEHVPHPPKMLIQRVEPPEQKTASPVSAKTPPIDEVDFFIPRPTKVINGIQQEDFAAKTIAFFGWIAYIVMRMLSLATFCCYSPKAFFILVGVHYIVMLLALCLESRFKGNANVFLFYPVLAYVFIFVIMEFRVKFKKIRLWLVFYFIITMVENIVMTIIWYSKEEFDSWWFGFIAECINYSGILFVATLIVYYCLLKPKDVVLIVEDNSENI